MNQFNNLLMPKLGLTMTEGLLAEWSVSEGESVKEGDVLFVIETEKVANEVPAPADGVIGKILVQTGETVPVGAVIATWTGPGPNQNEIITEVENSSSTNINESVTFNNPEPNESFKSQDKKSKRIIATPLARRLAHEYGIDLTQISGTGPKGRVKAEDVRKCNEQTNSNSLKEESQESELLPSFEFLEVSSLHSSMAKRMTQAKQVPHFYLYSEAEVSELLNLREFLNASSSCNKLTINHFLIAAVARALKEFPEQNRIWLDEKIIQFNSVDVGLAVSTERGLIAPVLHNLESNTLDDIAYKSDELVSRTREGKATHNDLNGAAITISNAGMFNVTYMTPIINPPQSAILGVGSVRELFRPGDDGEPILRRELMLVLAADHRLHDGVSALTFLNHIIDLLQEPHRLLRGRS